MKKCKNIWILLMLVKVIIILLVSCSSISKQTKEQENINFKDDIRKKSTLVAQLKFVNKTNDR